MMAANAEPAKGESGFAGAFPAVILWRKRPSYTPTLRSLSMAWSQQKKRLTYLFIVD